MKDVIIRNMERLLQQHADSEREPIEPMTEWKWNRLYQIARKYDIVPWIAEGLRAYADDFFLQLSPALLQQMLNEPGIKSQEKLDRFLLDVDRSQGPLRHLSGQSLRAYYSDLLKNIQNIEE